MSLRPVIVNEACLRAGEIPSGMGYTGRYGSVHLLRLNVQSNPVTAILHNLIAWQISELDKKWSFKPKSGRTPDITNSQGEGWQIKTTSNKQIKGNKVSPNEGKYIAVKYSRKNFSIRIEEVLIGELKRDDWDRPEGTQCLHPQT